MAVHGFERLAGAVAEVARPLAELYDGKSKRHADDAASKADGQTKYGPPKRAPEPPRVAQAASVAQVLRVEAEPALVWEAGRAAWRCAGDDTRVSVQFADGSVARHVYARDTLIPVAAGMIHFPGDSAG
jgi:hypothetical protein